jgi:hypothetical protein
MMIYVHKKEIVNVLLDRRILFKDGDVYSNAIILFSVSLLYTLICHGQVECFVLAAISQSMKVHSIYIRIAFSSCFVSSGLEENRKV